MATRRVLPTIPLVTAEAVQTAKAACANFRRLSCALERAEKARDLALLQLFTKMGLSAEAVKLMSPERLAAEIQRRAGVSFAFESTECSQFAIFKAAAERNPLWREQFVARVGPAIASEVEASTRTQYSYDIVDRPREERPDVICLPKSGR